MMMRIKGGMVKTIRSNFKQKYRKNNQSITCQSCVDFRDHNESKTEVEKPEDTQLHVLEQCEAFEDIRNEFDVKSDAGIVQFYTEVVKRRIQAGEE